jgi:RNA-directed DNA polymerase
LKYLGYVGWLRLLEIWPVNIKKFFASIDHEILKNILAKHIADNDALWLLAQAVNSFYTNNINGVGLPQGNLISQLFINIFMNEFNQFIKRKLKQKYYIRYADDFLILHENKN